MMLTVYDAIKRSHVTEKAMRLVEQDNVFTLEVHKMADKDMIARAVSEIWKVEVLSVRIVNNAPRTRALRGKRVKQAGLKKALVKLKSGQKIEGWS